MTGTTAVNKKRPRRLLDGTHITGVLCALCRRRPRHPCGNGASPALLRVMCIQLTTGMLKIRASFRTNMGTGLASPEKGQRSRVRVKNASVTALGWETAGRCVRQSEQTAKRLVRQIAPLRVRDPVYTRKNIRKMQHRIRMVETHLQPRIRAAAQKKTVMGGRMAAQSAPGLKRVEHALDISLTGRSEQRSFPRSIRGPG